jgi:hypothetical protein
MGTSEEPIPKPFWHGRGTLWTPCDVCGAKVGDKCTPVRERREPGICPECAGTYAHIGNCSRLT